MHSLDIKISEIKEKLIEKDIKAIQKYKLKPIKSNTDIIDIEILNEYNYYVKLLKKINNYLNSKKNTIVLVEKDLENKLIYILGSINIEIDKIDIDIRAIGSYNESYMDCSYYNENEKGILYINYFKSKKYNEGYGTIILRNLENIIDELNKKLSRKELNSIYIIK
ncbi:MAG: hypothetical protein ACRDD7_15470 [Peptostreptococcaceae bacterium]